MESKFFKITEKEGVTEIELGSADFVSRPIISLATDELIEFITTNKPARIVLNFKNVKHISSEFITALIRINDHVGGNDGRMKFSHINKTVMMPLKLTNLAGSLFHVYETTSKAIDAF